MASRATVLIDTPTLVLVRVDHLVTDSFRRSVLPTATRAWRRSINCGQRTMYRAEVLAPDVTVEGKRCASFVAYANSHEAADGALAATMESLEARA